MAKKILLIDVSHLFFRAFFAIPRGLTNGKGEPINALFGVASMLLSLIESEKPDYIFGAKDEKGKTKRHEIMSDYKGQRPEMPSDLVQQLPKIFDIFAAYHIPLYSCAGFEGDDMLATIAERYRNNPEYEVSIISGDHDAFQLIGENVCVGFPQNGGKAPLCMKREEIFQKVGVYPEQIPDYKALVGDPSDNLKGVNGIGKTGAKLLSDFGTLENIFANLEKIPGKVQERLREQKDLAILTKQMATLDRNVECANFDLQAGSVQNISLETLEQFFREYQFHSLLNRLPRIRKTLGVPSADPEQDELWEEFEEAQKKSLSAVATEMSAQKEQDQMSLF